MLCLRLECTCDGITSGVQFGRCQGCSAFTGSGLDALLRNASVTDVVLCGVITNACVLLSALEAWDLGYSVSIVDDACAANTAEIHGAALSVARWLGCEVVTARDVLDRLTVPAAG
jgi:nicotinamidase-related amidase